jgi:hypothetical protein
MKLIAEIEALPGIVGYDADGKEIFAPTSLRLSCEGDVLTVGDAVVDLAEFRDALNAVAPLPSKQRNRVDISGDPSMFVTVGSAGEAKPAPTRAPDGSRIGISPRFAMRAVKPEANVEDVEDDVA